LSGSYGEGGGGRLRAARGPRAARGVGVGEGAGAAKEGLEQAGGVAEWKGRVFGEQVNERLPAPRRAARSAVSACEARPPSPSLPY